VVVRVEPVLEVEDVPVEVAVEVEDVPAVAAGRAGTAAAARVGPAVGVEVEDAPAVAAGRAGTAVAVRVGPVVGVEVEDAPGAVRLVACSAVGRDVTAVLPDASAAVRDGCSIAWAWSEAGRDGSRAALVLPLVEPPVVRGVLVESLVVQVVLV
jgi:hypothetical protein